MIVRRFKRSRVLFSLFALLLILRISLQRWPTTTHSIVRKMLVFPSSPTASNGYCPAAIRNVQGIYARTNSVRTTVDASSSLTAGDRSIHVDDAAASLQNVVLLVSANYGYRHMLELWTSMADRHQLQYAIVSMDRQLQSRLLRRNDGDTTTVLLASQRTATGASEFRSPEFNTITCNKMRVVLDILEHCKMDVVFSDVDNIFLQDPFQGELGRLIRSGQYDYIYQHNDREGSASCWKGDLEQEGNTGFYYLSHTASIVQDVMRDTLRTCRQPDNTLDDQTLFWNALRATLRNRQPYRHCNATGHNVDYSLFTTDATTTTTATQDTTTTTAAVTQLCCLNSTLYPIGLGNVTTETETFHANYLVGQQKKMAKLREVMQALHLLPQKT